jgi:hypothetical protein
MYVTSDDKTGFDTPFDISKIPVVSREQADAEDRTKKLTASTPSLKPPKVGPTKATAGGADAAASAAAAAQRYAQELMQIPEVKEFGNVLKSSLPIELTESETEYVVSVVKHIFPEHVVLQYEVKNTLPSTVLENVSVMATPAEEEELEEVFIIQAEKLPTDEPGKILVAFRKTRGESTLAVSSFSNVLKFTVKEIDPSTNEPEETGYDDEYEVGEFELTGADYVIPTFASNFNHIWEQVGASGEEATETLQLSGMKSIAGKLHSDTCLRREKRLTMINRSNRAASQVAVPAAAGWDGRAGQPDDAYAEAAGQDRRWRTSGGQHQNGVLGQVRGDDENGSPQRGRGCRGSCDSIGCVMTWFLDRRLQMNEKRAAGRLRMQVLLGDNRLACSSYASW